MTNAGAQYMLWYAEFFKHPWNYRPAEHWHDGYPVGFMSFLDQGFGDWNPLYGKIAIHEASNPFYTPNWTVFYDSSYQPKCNWMDFAKFTGNEKIPSGEGLNQLKYVQSKYPRTAKSYTAKDGENIQCGPCEQLTCKGGTLTCVNKLELFKITQPELVADHIAGNAENDKIREIS